MRLIGLSLALVLFVIAAAANQLPYRDRIIAASLACLVAAEYPWPL